MDGRFRRPDLAARSGLSTDAVGRLLTDETLTSIDDPRILAAGDAAAPSGQPLRMSCQAAIPLGAHAAGTILSRLAESEPAAIDIAFIGQCISLGRKRATMQLAHFDDTARRAYLAGRVAATVKEAIANPPCGASPAKPANPAPAPPSRAANVSGASRPPQRWPISGRPPVEIAATSPVS